MRKLLKALFIIVAVMLGAGIGSALLLNSRANDTAQPVKPSLSYIAPIYAREDLLTETNKYRNATLLLDPVLNSSAQERCEALAAKGEFEHGNDWKSYFPEGRGYVGENLAYGYSTAKEVVDNWVASPAHNANIISKDYADVGFGICPFRGSTLVVQYFSD